MERYRIALCTVVVDAAGEGRSTVRLPDGASRRVEATSRAGRIDLVPELVGENQGRDLRNILLHEATHACQPAEPLPLPGEPKLRDGTVAYAVQGLSILVRRPDGRTTAFRKIEEGACEALAHLTDGVYAVRDRQYAAVGSLTLMLMHRLGVTGDELQDWVETNDVWNWVARVLRRPRSPDDFEGLERVMIAYQEAWNGGDRETLIASLLGD